jgi:hypothetical protein
MGAELRAGGGARWLLNDEWLNDHPKVGAPLVRRNIGQQQIRNPGKAYGITKMGNEREEIISRLRFSGCGVVRCTLYIGS